MTSLRAHGHFKRAHVCVREWCVASPSIIYFWYVCRRVFSASEQTLQSSVSRILLGYAEVGFWEPLPAYALVRLKKVYILKIK